MNKINKIITDIPKYMLDPVTNFDCTRDNGQKRPQIYTAKNYKIFCDGLLK